MWFCAGTSLPHRSVDWPTSHCSKGKDARDLTRSLTVVLSLGLCVSCSVAGTSRRPTGGAVAWVYLNKVFYLKVVSWSCLFCGVSCLFIWGGPLAVLEKVTELAQEGHV